MSNKLLKRIRALFELASNNPSPQEAQSALEMARKLLQEHNLTMIDVENVEADKSVEGGYSETTNIGQKIQQWKKSLSVLVAEYLDVKVVIRKYPGKKQQSFLFYGVVLNTEVAIKTFLSLLAQIEEMVKKYNGKGVYAKGVYRDGIITGLDRRLAYLKRRQSAKCTALAVCSDKVADRWMENEGIRVRKAREKTRKETLKEEKRKNDELGWDRQRHFSRGVSDSHGLVIQENTLEGDTEPDEPEGGDAILDSIINRYGWF